MTDSPTLDSQCCWIHGPFTGQLNCPYCGPKASSRQGESPSGTTSEPNLEGRKGEIGESPAPLPSKELFDELRSDIDTLMREAVNAGHPLSPTYPMDEARKEVDATIEKISSEIERLQREVARLNDVAMKRWPAYIREQYPDETTALHVEGSRLMMELFNRMPVKALKDVPSDIALQIGDFMVANGYRFVFDRWYLQAEPKEPARHTEKTNADPFAAPPCIHCDEAHALIDGECLDIGSGNIADRLGDLIEAYQSDERAMRSALEQIKRGPPTEMDNSEVAAWASGLAVNALACIHEPGPERLVGALQDSVHKDLGPVRAGRSVKTEAMQPLSHPAYTAGACGVAGCTATDWHAHIEDLGSAKTAPSGNCEHGIPRRFCTAVHAENG